MKNENRDVLSDTSNDILPKRGTLSFQIEFIMIKKSIWNGYR